MGRPNRVVWLTRVVTSRRAGGRTLPAALQLLLIVLWHFFMVGLMGLIPFEEMTSAASRLWYAAGVTSSYVSVGQPTPSDLDEWWVGLALMISPVLVEALLGWLGFRMIRRPRPRWYRFIRFWWRSCLYATFALPLAIAVVSVTPTPTFMDIAGVSVWVLAVGYLTLGPAMLARREFARRAKRIARLCPACGYWLHGIDPSVCPECGAILAHSQKGGYEVAISSNP